jgi:hypothetical protein
MGVLCDRTVARVDLNCPYILGRADLYCVWLDSYVEDQLSEPAG